MPVHDALSAKNSSGIPHNPVKEIIYLLRSLIQAEELFTKELDKRYQVSVNNDKNSLSGGTSIEV